jgi:hypothetical protein
MSTDTGAQKPLAVRGEALRRALSARTFVPRGSAWVQDVRLAAANLIVEFKAHIARSEGPEGLIATLRSPSRETVPTLDRRAQELRSQLTRLLDLAESFYLRVRNAQARSRAQDVRLLRRDGAEFLKRLDRHLEAETKLLLDSLNVVVGVGD